MFVRVFVSIVRLCVFVCACVRVFVCLLVFCAFVCVCVYVC